jgi:hypothetical protein
MQTNLVEVNGMPGSDASIVSDQKQLRQTLEDSYALNQLNSANPDYELTVAAAARKMGKSARTVQRMLISGQLKGYKVAGAKGPEWRIQQRQSPVHCESQTCSGASADKVALIEARTEEMQKRITELVREQEMVRARAEQVYRQCFEMLHENKRQLQESTLEAKRDLKDYTDTLIRQTAQDLQVLRERVLSQPIELSDQQLRAIGNQVRRGWHQNKPSWWAAIRK